MRRDQLASNDHFRVNARKQDEFIIEHYAGPVAYNTSGFLDKNKDMLNTGTGGQGMRKRMSRAGYRAGH